MTVDRSKDDTVIAVLFFGLIALMVVGLTEIFERMGG